MASTDTKPTARTRILHVNKNSQINTCRPTDCFGMRQPDRKNSGQTLTAHYSIAEIVRKDTTDFINFIESKKFQTNTLLVAMYVTSLYTNIPQVEGTQIVRSTYEEFYQNNPPIPTVYIKHMLRFILQENSFKLTNKHFLQLCGTAIGTEAAVAFANSFMAKIEN